MKRTPRSSSPSGLSMKSDTSMDAPLNFGTKDPERSFQKRTPRSSSPSGLSMKSDRSMDAPLNFGTKDPERSFQKRTPRSSSPSGLSMKSDTSMGAPLNFGTKDPERRQMSGGASSGSLREEHLKDPVKLGRGPRTDKRLSSGWDESDSAAAPHPRKCRKKEGKEPELQRDHTGDSHVWEAMMKIKETIKENCTFVAEGNDDHMNPLNKIFTALHITGGERAGPFPEHEYIDLERKRSLSSDRSVMLSDIIKVLKPYRTVLTKGNAGMGKSFSVQKFILDWADGKENQDLDFVFCLAFREMNLCRGTKSLHDLLTDFHPGLRGLKGSEDYVQTKVVVILDGLDESRIQLDFNNMQKVTSVTEVSSLGNLLANLIVGNLLPDAYLWITSRSVAANQIPAKYVDMVTEIRGFDEAQKVEYFKRKFSHDLSLAERIISHIQSALSLDIMCQIPIFCWISAALFEQIFMGNEKAETPQTLTEMIACFLFVQATRRSRKCVQNSGENLENVLETRREILLKLGKLAFVHLLNNDLIFYEEDLENCGIDMTEISTCSEFFTSLLREEKIFCQTKVFSFVHLTIQEFFAALYVYDCFTNKKTAELSNFLNLMDKEHTLVDLLKMTVDKVCGGKNNHLVYFMQFLLGLVVESNRRVLRGLLRPSDPEADIGKKILTYIKSLRRKTLSPDCCISLFQAMVEMKDQRVKDEIQEYLKLEDHSETELSPLQCSALAYMLQVSKNDLEILDLKSYNTSDEGRRRLIPAVKSSTKAVLADCKVTAEWVQQLAFDLKFPNTPLRDLNLSNNDLEDSGVKLLCDGLSSPNCRLETLSLSGCLITEVGCSYLVSALQWNPSHLRELDLSYNNPGDSGMKLLSELTEDPQYKLIDLNVQHCGSQFMKPGLKKYACELTLNPNTAHKNLSLSEGNRRVTWVDDKLPYPDHAERFDLWPQVLCEQGLTQRCYWELDVCESFNVGVSYRSIGRKGQVDACRLGHNNKSWSLLCSEDGSFILKNNERTRVHLVSLRCRRVGVYLDWPAGALSFYSLSSKSRTHLRTLREAFEEPLHPPKLILTGGKKLHDCVISLNMFVCYIQCSPVFFCKYQQS